ncbi:MAG: pyridoxal-phosphate dependent enzyme [Chlorobi bacterium]|nr:pyridoxal-phosphate dependent enzyme [Chlorobiota bacterium]
MKQPSKLFFANIPTPLRRVKFDGCVFYVKRDDLTGLELSGNKVRKLEYLLFDAKKKNADYVFTVGGDQSNHCRATAIAASALELKTKLFLWGKENKSAEGNQFFYNLTNAEKIFLNKKEYQNVEAIALKEKEKLEKKGEKVYWIPEGGSDALGIWGYVNFVDELLTQTGEKKFNGILCAAGTGGTAAGLLVGFALNNLSRKVFAVNVLYPADVLREKIIKVSENAIEKFKLKIKINYNDLVILDGYDGGGYKKVWSESVELSKRFFGETTILTDQVYTGKAFYAYYDNFVKNKRSNKIIFLHTGGLFGVFPKKRFYL